MFRRKTIEDRLWKAVYQDLGQRWMGIPRSRHLIATRIDYGGGVVNIQLEDREALRRRNLIYREGIPLGKESTDARTTT